MKTKILNLICVLVVLICASAGVVWAEKIITQRYLGLSIIVVFSIWALLEGGILLPRNRMRSEERKSVLLACVVMSIFPFLLIMGVSGKENSLSSMLMVGLWFLCIVFLRFHIAKKKVQRGRLG